MAGDWIKMRADLLTHPKVVRIVSALKADKLRVIGGLHAVWSLFDAHSSDGTLDGYTSEALDDYIGWPGFCAAMVLVGWLEESGESLTTPRFDEHNGQSAKRRATETQRKRMAREDAEKSALDADKLRSREEKSREDKKNTKEKKSAAAPILRPDDVSEQVWGDWLQLRKTKRATVSQTVIDEARAESLKAGLPFERFLAVWCARGSQGLQAEWLKPNERAGASTANASKYAGAAKAIWGDNQDERTIDA